MHQSCLFAGHSPFLCAFGGRFRLMRFKCGQGKRISRVLMPPLVQLVSVVKCTQIVYFILDFISACPCTHKPKHKRKFDITLDLSTLVLTWANNIPWPLHSSQLHSLYARRTRQNDDKKVTIATFCEKLFAGFFYQDQSLYLLTGINDGPALSTQIFYIKKSQLPTCLCADCILWAMNNL